MGGDGLRPPTPRPKGTLTPLIPFSFRAFKGEGKRRIGACICAEVQMHAPNSVPGGGRGAGRMCEGKS